MTTFMGDSVNPAAIPLRTAAAYINGEYAWSRAEESRFGRLVRISVEPGLPDAAAQARVLDVERYAATSADIVPFVQARAALGHHDATIYASAWTISQLDQEVIDAVPRWWVAWWWGRPGFPSRDGVAGEVGRLSSGARVVELNRVWGCQYRPEGSWDRSVVYGPNDFAR